MTARWEGARATRVFRGRSPMSSMAKMAIFVVLGSALTVAALMIASYLNAAAG
jgi:ABC-type lipoprotein release transport system permease subunit